MKLKSCRGRQKQFPKYLSPVKEKPVLKPAKVKDLLDQIQYIPPMASNHNSGLKGLIFFINYYLYIGRIRFFWFLLFKMPFDTEQFILEIQQNNCIWNKRKYPLV